MLMCDNTAFKLEKLVIYNKKKVRIKVSISQ